MSAPPLRGARRVRPGERIDCHITVVGAIDEGGRDPVYIVWHHRAWCAMACKLFETPAQARWETRTLSRLAHPSIVRLLENGAPRYMLTEFLEGPSLRRLLRSRPNRRLAMSDALRVAIHVGAALAHLHDRGYVHLDVKPGNIIVTRRRPVLFDLGTARLTNGRRLPSPQGTDPYMAPEQCRAGVPTTASDVYGLGVTLFEMLAGARPFPDGDEADPFPQLRTAPAPLRRFRPRAPQSLADLVAACLAPEPADRPSLAALLPALNARIRSGPRMWPETLALGGTVPTNRGRGLPARRARAQGAGSEPAGDTA